VLVFTSRRFVDGGTPTRSLQIGSRISDALVELVRRLESRPRYLIAKGGITESDPGVESEIPSHNALGQPEPAVAKRLWRGTSATTHCALAPRRRGEGRRWARRLDVESDVGELLRFEERS
jgi:hypothetical protein